MNVRDAIFSIFLIGVAVISFSVAVCYQDQFVKEYLATSGLFVDLVGASLLVFPEVGLTRRYLGPGQLSAAKASLLQEPEKGLNPDDDGFADVLDIIFRNADRENFDINSNKSEIEAISRSELGNRSPDIIKLKQEYRNGKEPVCDVVEIERWITRAVDNHMRAYLRYGFILIWVGILLQMIGTLI